MNVSKWLKKDGAITAAGTAGILILAHIIDPEEPRQLRVWVLLGGLAIWSTTRPHATAAEAAVMIGTQALVAEAVIAALERAAIRAARRRAEQEELRDSLAWPPATGRRSVST